MFIETFVQTKFNSISGRLFGHICLKKRVKVCPGNMPVQTQRGGRGTHFEPRRYMRMGSQHNAQPVLLRGESCGTHVRGWGNLRVGLDGYGGAKVFCLQWDSNLAASY